MAEQLVFQTPFETSSKERARLYQFQVSEMLAGANRSCNNYGVGSREFSVNARKGETHAESLFDARARI